MKLIKNNIDNKTRSGNIEVIPEKTADIYILHKLIEIDDLISAQTSRKITLESTKVHKKITLSLGIKVETSYLDEGFSKLYFKGKVFTEHKDVRKGTYHTIDVVLNSKICIQKNYWPDLSLEMIKKMMKSGFDMIFVIIYDKEVSIAFLSYYFVDLIEKVPLKKKDYSPVLESITKNLQSLKKVVIVTFKQEENSLFTFLKQSKSFRDKMCLLSSITLDSDMKSYSGKKIIHIIFSNPNYTNKIENLNTNDEIKEIELFKKNFVTRPELVCIGIDEIKEALDHGAVKNIITTHENYKILCLKNRKITEQIFQEVKNVGGNVILVPEFNSVGQTLKSLGSVIGNLKFGYKYV